MRWSHLSFFTLHHLGCYWQALSTRWSHISYLSHIIIFSRGRTTWDLRSQRFEQAWPAGAHRTS